MISIIVPVYNVELYLEECIDSIIRQSYQDIEIILVDDGSTDQSGVICDKYAAQDVRVKVFHKINGGLSSARNYGIDKATGAYLLFIDSDDFIKEDYCERFIESIGNTHSIGFVSSNLISYKNSDDLMSTKGIIRNKEMSYSDFFKSALRARTSNSVCGKLFNRDFISQTRFRNGRNNEDTLFLFDLYEHNRDNYWVIEVSYQGYYYRYRESSICHDPSNPLYLQILSNDLLMKQETHDCEIKSLIDHTYWLHAFYFCEELLREKYWQNKHNKDIFFREYYTHCKNTSCSIIWDASRSIKTIIKFMLMTRLFYIYNLIFVK